jgi:AbrB family looped-hinge helix DNA binding protein
MATRVTSKGQVTVPKRVRTLLGIGPGSSVEFELAADGRVVMTKLDRSKPVSPFEKVRGSLGAGMSTDEIMAFLRD